MKKFVFALCAVVAGSMAHGVQATSDIECHLNGEGANDIIIGFDQVTLFSKIGRFDTTQTQKNTEIPAGTYNVFLESYDGHTGRAEQVQVNERYFAEFRKGKNVIATSGTTEDLEDGMDYTYRTDKVNSYLEIPSNIDNLNLVHAKINGAQSPNSVVPVCMLLLPKDEPKDPICGNGIVEEGEKCDDGNDVDDDQCSNSCKIPEPKDPMCGNGIVEAGEQCDDGNDVDNDQCSNSCKIPRTIVDPICGNGIVEAGEQCDDGNRDNDDQCSNSCKIPDEPEEEEHDDCDASIGDTIFNDKNGNAIQDAGEEGIKGVKVKLQYGDKVRKEYTDSDGEYEFDDLCEDTYRVIVGTETLDEGCYQTYDRDGKLDHMYKRALEEDEDYTKADFGYHCPSAYVHRVSPETGAGGAAGAASAASAAVVAWLSYRRLREDAGTIIPMG